MKEGNAKGLRPTATSTRLCRNRHTTVCGRPLLDLCFAGLKKEGMKRASESLRSMGRIPTIVLTALWLSAGCVNPCRQFKFHEVSAGIYQGCQPRTRADFDQLRQAGVRTILSLQTFRYHTWPERRRAARSGISFVNIPVLASPLAPKEKEIRDALLALSEPSLRPVYIHCLYGRDRAAMVLGLYRVYYENWTPEAAWQEMVRQDFTVGWNLRGFETFFWKHARTRPPWVHPNPGAMDTISTSEGAVLRPGNPAAR